MRSASRAGGRLDSPSSSGIPLNSHASPVNATERALFDESSRSGTSNSIRKPRAGTGGPTSGGGNALGGGGPSGANGKELELQATTCDELARVIENRKGSREASTLSEALRTFDVVESVLRRNRENLREFFSACFQPVLWRAFSFDGYASEGWFNAAFHGDEKRVREFLSFFSPESSFMRAMRAADADRLVQFAFPLERLPERTQRMLQTESGAAALNRAPPYAGCVKRDSAGKYQVHLGLYDYFIFWLAYFSMRPGGGGRGSMTYGRSTAPSSSPFKSDRGYGASSSGTFLSGQWPTTPLMSRSSSAQVHPYHELLLAHLSYFLPREAASSKNWSKGTNDSTGANSRQGEVLVSILAEFWMPVEEAQSSDVARHASSPFRSFNSMGRVVDVAMRNAGMTPPRSSERTLTRHYSYNPPATEHVNAVSLLVTYLFAELSDRRKENADAMKVIDRARELIQRPLYGFLREAFTQWPTESSTNLSPIVTLWVCYCAPWCAKHPESQLKKSSTRSSSPRALLSSPLKSPLMSSDRGASISAKYDDFLLQSGKGFKFDDDVVDTPGRFSHVRHVLKSIPFYHELMKHFLELCCKRVPLDAEGTAMALRVVLEPLAASPKLLQILQDVEDGYAEFVLDPFKGTLKTMHAREEVAANAESYYPLIRTQLQAWEPDVETPSLGDSLPGTPSATKNSPLSKWHGAAARLMANRESEMDKAKSGSKHLRMFTPETDGLAQVAIALIHRLERDATQVPMTHVLRKHVPRFRTAAFTVFRLERFRDTPYLKSPTAAAYVDADASERRNGWASGRTSAKEMYRGDWIHRPVGANEITLFVRLLVPLSVYLNKKMGLDGVATLKRKLTMADARDAVSESWIAARRVRRENAALEYVIPILAVIQALTLGMCRKKGITVNLRPLAEYQMLVLIFTFRLLIRFFGALFA